MAKKPEAPARKCPVCRQELSGNYCVACNYYDDNAVANKAIKIDNEIERRSAVHRLKQLLYRLFGRF